MKFRLLPKTRVTYWSNGPVAEYVRKILKAPKKPRAATMEEWNVWEREYKINHRFTYIITDICLSTIQNAIYFPSDIMNTVAYYFRNRFTRKYSYIDTKLNRWEYHSRSERVLHALAEMVVDYVEVSLASRQYWNNTKKYKLPKFKPFRCPDAGLDYLRWEIDLVKTDTYSADQSNIAIEVLALYHWWTHVRPSREDPAIASGWSNWYNKTHTQYSIFPNNDGLTEEEKQEKSLAAGNLFKLEEAYNAEDKKMLARLAVLIGDLR